MRPAWRLAINSLSERRSRTALLVATVAMSASLIVAVSCAMASMQKGIEERAAATVGASDIRLEHIGRRDFDASVMDDIRAWPGVELVVGRVRGSMPLKNIETGVEVSTNGYGIDLEVERRLRPVRFVSGRDLSGPGEVVLDAPASEELGIGVGGMVEVQKFGDAFTLTVVGVSEAPPLGVMVPAESFVSFETMWRKNDRPGRVREVDVVLADEREAPALVAAHRADFEKGMLLRASARLTSGLEKNLRSNQLGMILASAIAFLSAGFIVLTALSTNVNERQRELAVLRCIGGRRAQLAEAQLVIGFLVGGVGALLGVPIGLLGAWVIIMQFPEQLPSGFVFSPTGIVSAFVGAIGAGLIGSAWPAFKASRTSPLAAMASEAKPVGRRGVVLALIGGLLGISTHLAIVGLPSNGQVVFWGDVTIGLPGMFIGYFLLSVPMAYVVGTVLGPVISRLLGLPRHVLSRTVRAMPFRYGFTSGAMMVGLAMLVALWTNGQAVMRDWLDRLDFPDAFLNSPNLTEAQVEEIGRLPGVTKTCAITLQPMETDAFGVRALNEYKTTYIAFEPDAFFSMMRINFVEGDEATAHARLNEGGALLIAEEFKVARGLGVGDELTLSFNGEPHTFDVVGVVTSPGLDVVSKYFEIGEEYMQQSVNAVFGSRSDLKEIFGNDAIHLIQMSLAPDADVTDVLNRAKRIGGGFPGSGREIKAEIRKFVQATMLIFSTVAVASMLVACFGVANLIVAQIHARQYEFGVLRAIGATRGLLARMVLGEAMVIALTACVVGTIMGTEAAWAGQRLYKVLVGLVLNLRLPIGPVAMGWCVVTVITLGASGPAVWRLSRRKPRELLSVMKG